MIEIYTLSDSTGVRYVGQAKSAENRYRQHLYQAGRGKTAKDSWLRDCAGCGEPISMIVIDSCSDRDAAFVEMYWIYYYIIAQRRHLLNERHHVVSPEALDNFPAIAKHYQGQLEQLQKAYDELYRHHCEVINQPPTP